MLAAASSSIGTELPPNTEVKSTQPCNVKLAGAAVSKSLSIDMIRFVTIFDTSLTEIGQRGVEMDLFTTDLNYWAVIVATAIGMIVGSLWYSPLLFAEPWLRLIGKTMETLREEGHGTVLPMVVAVIGAFVTSYVLALAINASSDSPGLVDGIVVGAVLWAGLVGVQNLMGFLFSGRPIRLWILDSGNQLVTFVLMGLVIGLWR